MRDGVGKKIAEALGALVFQGQAGEELMKETDKTKLAKRKLRREYLPGSQRGKVVGIVGRGGSAQQCHILASSQVR